MADGGNEQETFSNPWEQVGHFQETVGTKRNLMGKGRNEQDVETGLRDVAPMYNTAMALVYVHVQCTVSGPLSTRKHLEIVVTRRNFQERQE